MKASILAAVGFRSVSMRLGARTGWARRLLPALALPAIVQAQFKYTTANNEVTITGYTGSGSDVNIPGTLEGLLVARIGVGAFQHNPSLTSVTIPNSVTSIGDHAFSYCNWLTNVTIPNSVTNIGGYAFSFCNGLASVTIPDSIRSIGDYAFTQSTRLTSVTIPNSIHSIGGYTFYGCTRLASVTIPNSVTSIGEYAFGYCNALTSLAIPNSVTNIGANAFSDSARLASVTVDGDNAFYSSADGVLFNKNKTTLIQSPAGKTGNYIIPNSVTNIGANAFYYCTNLANVTIPNSVINIGTNAFYFCTGLTSVTIPNSITSIADGAFNGCAGLTNVTIPNSVTNIGANAFYACTGLTSVAIPNSVTSIADRAFYGCAGLTGVTIPNSVTNIGASAFYACTGLTSVAIPNSVPSIADRAFYGCAGLTGLTMPSSVTSIGYAAFGGCARLTNVTIPDNVTSIGELAFSHCKGLTNVMISASVTSIGGYAFSQCSGLSSVTIPNSVTRIGGYAFSYCSGLSSVTIPNSVTRIGRGAFYFCLRLTSVAVDGDNTFYSSADGVLFNKDRTTIVQYPAGKAGGYMIPNSVTNIGADAFSACIALISMTVDGDNAFYSSADGVLFNKNQTTLVQYPAGKSGGYIIPNSVTNIGADAFYFCTRLTSVTVNEGNAFFSSADGALFNKNQTTLILCPAGKPGGYIIPNSVTNIAIKAFDYCTALTSITIPDAVSNIGDVAFYNCSGLRRVYFLGNAPSLRSMPFESTLATIYYLPGTTGWGSELSRRPAVEWNPKIVSRGVGVAAGRFGVAMAADVPVMVEGCDDLENPNWEQVATVMLGADGTGQFSDPRAADGAARFYRFRAE